MNAHFSISDAFFNSWKALKSQIWILVGLFVGFYIIYFTLSIFLMPSSTTAFSFSIKFVIGYIVMMLFSLLFYLGYTKNCFQALDGEEPQFSAYGKQAPKIFKALVASLFVVAIVCVGFCLLIIPGIYLCARLQFYIAAIVEEDAGIMESLNRSWNLTKGNVMRLVLLFLSQIGIIIVGLLLLIIGVFVAEPVICLMYCDTYRQLCKNLPAEAKETIPQEETAI